MNRNNRNAQAQSHVTGAEDAKCATIDRILAGEDTLIPSSGFAAAVMERVREEATAPAPIPFPWKRTIPAATVIIGLLAWLVKESAGVVVDALRSIPTAKPAVLDSNLHALASAGWIALALVASLVSWLLSRRLAEGSGLL